MALSEFKQGTTVCIEGESLQDLFFVAKGRVEVSFNGRPFHFEKGDMIGLFDLGTGVHSHTYTAVADTTLIKTPYEGAGSLDDMIRDNADVATLLIDAMCRKVSECLQYKLSLKRESERAYELIKEIYSQYEQLCKQYAFTTKVLPGVSEIEQFSDPDPAEDWLNDYYSEMRDLDAAVRKSLFYEKPGISLGFFSRGIDDLSRALRVCEAYQRYLAEISNFFLTVDKHDLFALVSDLHVNSIKIKGADAAVETLMGQLTKFLSGMTGIDPVHYRERMSSYKALLSDKRSENETTDAPDASDTSDTPVKSGMKQNLSGSLDFILEYSECPKETYSMFTRCVHEYTQLTDRGSSDENATALRKDLTKMFNGIYGQVLIKSIGDPELPTIIKMFLNFGYVDAELAGHDNADFLYSIADSFRGNPEAGIYTLREWMSAIFAGEKDPSRSELDVDYTEYIRQMKVEGKIDAKEEIRLAADLEGRLRFELENVFPIVNRITSGAVSLFCPLFSDQNIQRKLEASLVTPDLLKEAFDEIRKVDFSAFYRETAYSNRQIGVVNDVLTVEVLPELILMPNIGTRGIMWQDINGKRRTTPSRMFIPIFLQDDIRHVAVKLTGEFRWEICKRIQGSRWGDVTDPSLTSEYCDYLQFYKKNRDLSNETKDAIKSELARSRNNFKTVFVTDYADWLQYEANGMPRLNKAVCRILFMYCPFPAETREKLIQTFPRYADLSKRFNIKQHQRVKRLSNLIQQITHSGKEVPQEIHDELEHAGH